MGVPVHPASSGIASAAKIILAQWIRLLIMFHIAFRIHASGDKQ